MRVRRCRRRSRRTADLSGDPSGGGGVCRWGGNLEGVIKHPVQLNTSARLVYTPHVCALQPPPSERHIAVTRLPHISAPFAEGLRREPHLCDRSP